MKNLQLEILYEQQIMKILKIITIDNSPYYFYDIYYEYIQKQPYKL
jgi:hypothetical protein